MKGVVSYRLVVDRIEGENAMVEWQERFFEIPKGILPRGTREGDVLRVSIEKDEEETEKRKKEAKDLIEDLAKRGGDTEDVQL